MNHNYGLLTALSAIAAGTILASAVSERAASLPATNRKARFDLAAFRMSTDRPVDAVPLLESLAERDPSSAYLALKLAAARFAARDYRGAAQEYGRLLARHTDCPPAEYNLALALRELGRSDEARPLLQSFIDKYAAILPEACAQAELLIQHL